MVRKADEPFIFFWLGSRYAELERKSVREENNDDGSGGGENISPRITRMKNKKCIKVERFIRSHN
jgi:hypothetical protein